MIQRGLKYIVICGLLGQSAIMFNTLNKSYDNALLAALVTVIGTVGAITLYSLIFSGVEWLVTTKKYKENYWKKFSLVIDRRGQLSSRLIIFFVIVFLFIIIFSFIFGFMYSSETSTQNILLLASLINAYILTYIRNYVYMIGKNTFIKRLFFFNIFIKARND